jgi:hypothetical protein
LVTQHFLPHHSVTASKRATATEVNKCSDQFVIFEGSENERLGRTCVCEKFCFKLGKTATERWKMLQQAFGDELGAERSVLSGTVISKHKERQLMKIPEVEGLPCQQMTFTSKQFVICFSKIAV